MSTTRKIGYIAGHETYGEWRASLDWKQRALCALGDILDRMIRPADAPIFPKDAPMDQPNCGVVAMCMLTDRPYSEVAPILARGRSSSWGGGTFHHQYVPCAKELGFETTDEGNGMSIGRRLTLGQLADSTEGKPGRIFATVRGHAICIWDGLIFDQGAPAGKTSDEHSMAGYQVTYLMRRA
jgi:hypothetical protein